MLLATTIELFDGLVARGIPGQGRLAEIADSAQYDATHVHTDVLVVGAGPAGLAAALTAARTGARVVLVDEHSEAGGALLGSTDTIDGAPALDWVADAVAELADLPRRAAPAAHHRLRALRRRVRPGAERRTDHLGGEAPGGAQPPAGLAHPGPATSSSPPERTNVPSCSPTTTVPASCSPHGARTFLHRYGVKVGEQAVVFTTNDSAYARRVRPARRWRADQRHRRRPRRVQPSCARPSATGAASRCAPARWSPAPAATSASPTPWSARVPTTTSGSPLSCDVLLVSGGWNPAVHLFSQARGQLRYDDALGAFVPGEQLHGVSVAGSANGVFDLAGCLRDGREAAAAALRELGFAPCHRRIRR